MKKNNDRKKTRYSNKLYVKVRSVWSGNIEKIEIGRKKRKIVRIVRNKGFKKEKNEKINNLDFIYVKRNIKYVNWTKIKRITP